MSEMILSSDHEIAAFVYRLAVTPAPENAVNPYAASGEPYSAMRRHNLARYLEQMTALQPTTMLVLEAPGYRGMRLTGVPALGRWLRDGVPELGLFGLHNGYVEVMEPGFVHFNSSQTASAVWSTLAGLGRAALVWNAYPFHPHLRDQPASNRTPRRAEIEIGRPFLQWMLDRFAPPQVIAVGRIAERALTLLAIDHITVRHPAQGGYRLFVEGVRTAMGGIIEPNDEEQRI